MEVGTSRGPRDWGPQPSEGHSPRVALVVSSTSGFRGTEQGSQGPGPWVRSGEAGHCRHVGAPLWAFWGSRGLLLLYLPYSSLGRAGLAQAGAVGVPSSGASPVLLGDPVVTSPSRDPWWPSSDLTLAPAGSCWRGPCVGASGRHMPSVPSD